MKIIIVGGEAAGMSAAAKAKRTLEDAEVIVYEMSEVVSFGTCGLPYYVADYFSNENAMIARSVEKHEENGIKIRTCHEVKSVNPHKKTILVKNLSTGKEFEDRYDRLLVATGASPVTPTIIGIELNNVFTLRTMTDGISLKKAALSEDIKNVVIIGGGYIGLEMVEAMKQLKKEVTVIQHSEQVLRGSFDPELATIIEDGLKEKGVQLKLSEEVRKLIGNERVHTVVTDRNKYKADLVVISTGIRPNTTFLKKTGISMHPNGAIEVDRYGESSIKDIYAAGDCATVYHQIRKENVYIPLATNANKMGKIIGDNLVGGRVPFEGTLGSSCLKVMDYEAARTGIDEKEARELKIPFKTTFIHDKNQTDYYPGQESIHIKLIYHADTKTILGAQTVGKNGAVLRINALAVAIYSGLTTSQLGMMDFCYSPPFSRTWDALNIVGNASK